MARMRNAFEVNGARLAADRWPGSGPTLVLLHAGVADRRSWYATADLLSTVGTIVAYDRRGFGETPPSDVAFSHLDDLLAVLDQLTEQPAWLLGSSMGGLLAVDAAVTYPDRIAGLVLFAPAISGEPEPTDVDPVIDRLFDQLDAAMTSGDLDEANRLDAWVWLDGPTSPEGRVRGQPRELFLEMNHIVLINNVPEENGASNVDAWRQLEQIKTPITVACGDLDVPFLLDQCRELARRLANAQWRELSGTAHLPYLERPDVVASVIRDAIATR
jgi:pimeloyl-ACP methyl ester carboxylesterase